MKTAAILRAMAAAVSVGAPAQAQFYEKVDLGRAAVEQLVEALDGSDRAIGSSVAQLANCGDPSVADAFRAMVSGGSAASRVYGVLGEALATEDGIDPALFARLADGDERAAVIREANVTGLLRKSPVTELIAQSDLPDPALLSLMGEAGRRGEQWEPDRLTRIAASGDAVAAGFASLLLKEGAPGSAPDESHWRAFKGRLAALPPEERAPSIRGLIEAVLLFEVRSAATELLALSGGQGIPADIHAAAVGMALRLDPRAGASAWRAMVATDRSQRALVRAAMQLLASAGRDIPAGTFDDVRNGNAVLEAIADAGAAVCRGDDQVPALIALLDCGHSGAAEWALIKASELPADRSVPVWKHLLTKIDAANDPDEISPAFLAGIARELTPSDPAAVRALLDRVGRSEAAVVAVMLGVSDSRCAQAQEIARERRGTLPRLGESLAALTLARAGAPLTDADMSALGRAAAGGGDLDDGRRIQSAWFYARRLGVDKDAIRALAGTAVPGAPGGGTKP